MPSDQNPASRIRDRINTQLSRNNRSIYWLANSGKVDMAPNSVYRYLSGSHDTTGAKIEQMMDAVGLKIVESKRPSRFRKPRKRGS